MGPLKGQPHSHSLKYNSSVLGMLLSYTSREMHIQINFFALLLVCCQIINLFGSSCLLVVYFPSVSKLLLSGKCPSGFRFQDRFQTSGKTWWYFTHWHGRGYKIIFYLAVCSILSQYLSNSWEPSHPSFHFSLVWCLPTGFLLPF